MTKIKITNKRILTISILAALIFILLIPAIRTLTNKPLLPQDTPYYHLRMSRYIKQESTIPAKDPLTKSPYLPQPYHLLLIFNPLLASILIPLICGILSIILLYLILKQLNIQPLNKATILTAFIISPLFIFLFATSNQFALPLPITLLAFLFFIKGKNYFIPSLLLFAIMPIFGILPSIISILLILIYTINNKETIKYFYTITAAILIILLTYHLPFIFYYSLPNSIKLLNKNILTNLISDLGSNIGFGIFTILLAFVGLYTVWKTKKQITAYLLLLALILLSFLIQELNIYLFPIISIFAGFGLSNLIKMKWKIDLIKTLTIILIICGLLFSTLSYINRIAESSPTKEAISSLEWLKQNSAKTDVVFSHHSKAHWIETIAQRPTILNSQIYYIPDAKSRINDSTIMLSSRNFKLTKSLLDKYNIKYIYIDNEMKTGQVWTRQEQGLQFLFRNQETFEQVYNKDNIEIWVILR
ncbi:hypothetical protein KY332_03270 [Candidatus Woesearchaeota archaeon]|nr:hypothetical protein [Candidatus Woesearchaeota archaeon]